MMLGIFKRLDCAYAGRTYHIFGISCHRQMHFTGTKYLPLILLLFNILLFSARGGVITDSGARSIICKGPKYRFYSPIDVKINVKKLLVPYNDFVTDGSSESIVNLMLKILFLKKY